MGDIPGDLIINWDHTGIKYVPVSNWTFEKKGSKRVEIVGCDDKRQVTALLSCTLNGKILPVQVIYAGKTPACLPKITPPKGWNMVFTPNHWANEETMLVYLQTILLPYIQQKRSELGLVNNHPALVIFNQFKAQTTEVFLKVLEENFIYFVEVPAHCTDHLQPLDLSINKPIKDHLKKSFQDWYAGEVLKQMQISKENSKPIDLRLSFLKPLGLQWLINAWRYIQTTDFARNGFQEAGIADILP